MLYLSLSSCYDEPFIVMSFIILRVSCRRTDIRSHVRHFRLFIEPWGLDHVGIGLCGRQIAMGQWGMSRQF